jgi:fumarate reductase subunit C
MGQAVTEQPEYTGFYQHLYRPRVAIFWWLRRRSYLLFVIRELSSVFVAWFVVFMLVGVHAVAQGERQYRQFLAWSAQPWVLTTNVVALAFVVFHAVTWFNLAPKAIVPRLRGRRVPAGWVAAVNYAIWALASAVTAWVILG